MQPLQNVYCKCGVYNLKVPTINVNNVIHFRSHDEGVKETYKVRYVHPYVRYIDISGLQ